MSKAYDTAQQAMQDGLDTTHHADSGILCDKLKFKAIVKMFANWYWIDMEGTVAKDQAYQFGVDTAKASPNGKLAPTIGLLTAIEQA